MIFVDFDFGLLRSLFCKISYLLNSTEVIQIWEFDNLHIDSVCKDNSWIHGKCQQRFLSNVYKRFLFSPRFLLF